MLRNKNIVSFIVTFVLIAFLSSGNVISSAEKILENEITPEEEVELTEENKNNQTQYRFTSFDFGDSFLSRRLSIFYIPAKNASLSNFNSLRKYLEKTPLFILFCSLKVHFG